MDWKKLGKDSANDTAFIMGSMGAAQVFSQIVRSAIDKPGQSPHSLIPIIGFFVGLGFTWSAFFLQFISKNPKYVVESPERSTRPKMTQFYLKFSIITNILFMWNFFMVAVFAIYTAVNGEKKEMNDWGEFFPTVFGTFVLSLLTNASVRASFGKKYWDIVSEFCNKYSVMRDIIAQSEKIHMRFWGENHYSEWWAKWIRHGMSLAWGVGVGFYAGYYFKPGTKPYEIFPAQWQQNTHNFLTIFNIVFALTSFSINTVFDISSIAQPYRAIFAVGFGSLLPAILIRNYFFQKIQEYQELHEVREVKENSALYFSSERQQHLRSDLAIESPGSLSRYSLLSSPSERNQPQHSPAISACLRFR